MILGKFMHKLRDTVTHKNTTQSTEKNLNDVMDKSKGEDTLKGILGLGRNKKIMDDFKKRLTR